MVLALSPRRRSPLSADVALLPAAELAGAGPALGVRCADVAEGAAWGLGLLFVLGFALLGVVLLLGVVARGGAWAAPGWVTTVGVLLSRRILAWCGGLGSGARCRDWDWLGRDGWVLMTSCVKVRETLLRVYRRR